MNRRLLNTAETEPQQVRDETLNTFVKKMKHSGYNEDTVRQVLRRGILRYETFRNLERKGIRRLHRPAASTVEQRIRKKLTSKEDWYRSSNKEKEGKVEYERQL